MKQLLLLIILLQPFTSYGQEEEYLGAGNMEGITVTASSEFEDAKAINTINGSGLDVPSFLASRFLAQASIGYERNMINQVRDMGIEAWIEEQFLLPPSYTTPVMQAIWNERKNARIAIGENEEDIFGPWAVDFNYAWWQINMTNDDLLRHRVALALSEVLVISVFSNLNDRAEALCDYYDLLLEEAFGNYEDLLYKVSIHPAMGYYLSHLNNAKANPELNQRPDENYAREIMQLFSIGLKELNRDGTPKKANGEDIPTYDNNDIREMARVFTGLGPGAINENVWWTDEPYFGLDFWGTDPTVPMKMYPDFHDQGEKKLLNGYTIPPGQTGMMDIEDAVNHLFMHPNVGPFIAYRLIQRLVKSNPSPEYVTRVVDAFEGKNGGVRGDMKNTIRAILLDPEARNDEYLSMDESNKLREPLLRYTHVARMVEKDSPYGRYWHNGFSTFDEFKQHVLASPTVFNFFTPDHSPVGDISDNGLVAPEFKIHNTATSINYINKVNHWTMWWALMYSWEPDEIDDPVFTDFSRLAELAENPDVLLNEYDVLFTHGQLTDETRAIIREALEGITWGNYKEDRAKLGLYLLLISPDYALMK